MREILVAKALGEYEGKETMLKLASEEIMSVLSSNVAVEVNPERVRELDKWVERMHRRNLESLGRKMSEIG